LACFDIFDEFQLISRYRIVSEFVHFIEYLRQSAIGLLIADAGRDRKSSDVTIRTQTRVNSIGISFVFADVFIEPGTEISSQNGIHNLGSQSIFGIGFEISRLLHRDYGLHSRILVDKIDRVGRWSGYSSRDQWSEIGVLTPVSKVFDSLGSSFFGCNIAHHDEVGFVGKIISFVIFLYIVQGDGLYGLLRGEFTIGV